MKIHALKIEITTTNGDYGFSCTFHDSLNIIRGNNSSGKSTLLISIIYALGMEEILGGRGEKVFPYAIKDYIPCENEKYPIISSCVWLEISNKKGKYITLNRMIKSDEKNNKLIEIMEAQYLTGNVINARKKPTYIHDPGSAINSEVGYFKVLEDFLGLSLPYVPGTSGGEIKLYIQTLFSALFVEQKRGWTDYIANAPYFGIRNVKSKVVEYLLAMDIFENDRKRNSLSLEAVQIIQRWETEKYKIKLLEENNLISVVGVSSKPIINFDPKLVSIVKVLGGDEKNLEEYIGFVIDEMEKITQKKNNYSNNPIDLVSKMDEIIKEISRLNSLHESVVSDIQLNKTLLKDYSDTKQAVENDLHKNKSARKLKELGAEYQMKIAKDICPACHQHVDDSLLLADTHIQPMSIDENIMYLDRQVKMLDRYMSGINKILAKQNNQLSQVQKELHNKRNEMISIKRDMSSVSEISEADLRRKIRYEDEIKQLNNVGSDLSKILLALGVISANLKENKQEIAKLPSNHLSFNDKNKIKRMELVFKKLANDFGYKSANTEDIIINEETYLPFLSGLALREINETSGNKRNTDIKADSSASDFVRLIWAYLLSIYDASIYYDGNHFNLLAFDEPGQHSMADTSMNALLKAMNNYPGLQSIIAASFDENDSVFEKETEGVIFHLIDVGDKLIKKL